MFNQLNANPEMLFSAVSAIAYFHRGKTMKNNEKQ